jgi:hypothetical protein
MKNEQETVYIDAELLKLLDIEPEDTIRHLESKKALEIKPIHVRALMVLKETPVASS